MGTKKNKIKDEGYIWRTIISVAICCMGGFTMWITGGKTGIGWAILGLFIIWA